MSAMLVRYEAARQALALARNTDEAKAIRDKAVAVAAYAKQANDPELLALASEIKARAERRAGELLREMELAGERQPHGGDRKSKFPQGNIDAPNLSALGITRKQSSAWQRLAKVDEADFERELARASRSVAGYVTTAKLLHGLLAQPKQHDQPEEPEEAFEPITAAKDLRERLAALASEWPSEAQRAFVAILRDVADEMEECL